MIVHGHLELQLTPGGEGLYDRMRWALLMVSRARLRDSRVLSASLEAIQPVVASGQCRVPIVLLVERFEKAWLGTYEVAPNEHDPTPGARIVLEGVVAGHLEPIFDLTPASA
jgi:hypothetical protein